MRQSLRVERLLLLLGRSAALPPVPRAADHALRHRQRPRNANANAMQVFFDHVSTSRPPDIDVVMVLDGAGWRQSKAFAVSPNISLVVLPP